MITASFIGHLQEYVIPFHNFNQTFTAYPTPANLTWYQLVSFNTAEIMLSSNKTPQVEKNTHTWYMHCIPGEYHTKPQESSHDLHLPLHPGGPTHSRRNWSFWPLPTSPELSELQLRQLCLGTDFQAIGSKNRTASTLIDDRFFPLSAWPFWGHLFRHIFYHPMLLGFAQATPQKMSNNIPIDSL